MDRSRSSKRYYHDHHQDYDYDMNPSRTRPRYTSSSSSNFGSYNHSNPHYRRGPVGGGGGGAAAGGGGGRKVVDPSLTVTTSYRILCHDSKAGGVIGKSGSIIKAIRQHTGAWVNVHEIMPGDEERIIEISDTRRRDPDGRIPSFSPAQEALYLIHERILETEGEEEDGYGGGGGGGSRGDKMTVVTRLVVSRSHVGSLLGKGGKIIEHMRQETKTHIRVLPRDNSLPRCIAMSEEIVQVVGDVNAVKNAIVIISSRLRESQYRDRNNYSGRSHSPERFIPDEEFVPNNSGRRSSADEGNFGSRFSAERESYYSARQGNALESEPSGQYFSYDEIVFRILCPVAKVNCIFGDPDGILDLLQNEVGVDLKVTNPVIGSDEQVLIVTSDEGPDNELFPAQEALLHIQTHIADLAPDKDNIVATRLVLQAEEIGCFIGRDGSLSDISKIPGVDVRILPREELPTCVSDSDEILQIVGEIRAARQALLEVTSKLRSFFYRELFQNDTPMPNLSSPALMNNGVGAEGASGNHRVQPQENHHRRDPRIAALQDVAKTATSQPLKESESSSSDTRKVNESERLEEVPTGTNRFSVPLVTRSILEVVIPPYAASKLITKSRNKLAQISELSGANVKLVEDTAESTEKVIQISGTPEQAERAQSLLQGFILSIEEDEP